MKKIASLFFLLTTFSAYGNGDLIVSGKLKSGLCYYIVKTPSKSVNYYLIQNCGSAMENEQESGLAHFTEHLSFLSSENFKGSVQDFFTRNNLSNNASTYQNKIIYYGKGVDSENKRLNDSMLLVLHDWCGHLSLDPQEIEREKKIVMEEWRTKPEIDPRQMELAKSLYNNTKYAELNGLGNMPQLMSNSAERLKDFYKNWFSPSLCAIMIEGDVDVEQCKAKIEKLFSDIEPNEKYVKRNFPIIPDNEFIYKQIDHNNAGNILISSRIHYTPSPNLEEYCKERFYMSIYNGFIKQRLLRYKESINSDIFDFSVEYGEFMDGFRRLHIEVSPMPGRAASALTNVMANHYDLINKGLSESEIDDFKKCYPRLSGAANDYLEMAELSFLRNHPCYTFEEYRSFISVIAQNFDNQDFIEYCKRNIKLENLLCYVYTVSKQSALSKSEIETIIFNQDLKPREIEAKKIIFDTPSTQATVVSEQKIGTAVSWKLSNGLQVVYRQNNGAQLSEIEAISIGGLDALPFSDILYGQSVTRLAEMSGIEDYDRAAVRRYEFVNGVNVALSIESSFEKINATGNSLDDVLELLYLKIEKATFDEKQFANKQRLMAQLYSEVDLKTEYQQKLEEELYGKDIRKMSIGEGFLRNIDCEKLKTIFDTKFKNASQWQYVITSSLSAEDAKSIIVKYLGSMTSGENGDIYKRQRTIKLKKDFTKTIHYGTANNNGGTDMNYVYTEPLSGDDRANLKVLTHILKQRLEQEFRGNRAAVYGMIVECYTKFLPDNLSVININFGSKKEDQESLAAFVAEDIKRIAKDGVTLRELDAALQKREFNNDFKESVMDGYLAKQNYVKKSEVTLNTLRKFAKKIEKKSIIIRFIFK